MKASTDAKRHLVYLYLLKECLSLDDMHRKVIERTWNLSSEDIEDRLIRSAPTETQKIICLPELAKMFDYDLQGVPGFFFGRGLSQYDALAHMVGLKPLSSEEYTWRINLYQERAVLKPYFNERNRITGLFIYRSTKDWEPYLLSSGNLCLGTPAIKPQPQIDRSLAA